LTLQLIPSAQIQSRLLKLAAVFLFLSALVLTLAPAARERAWDVQYRWSHWVGLALWVLLVSIAHWQTRRQLQDADPYLLPLAALLSGWGLLTIWRLTSEFGMRQAIWLLISIAFFVLGLRLHVKLTFLRRYKYLWLTGGLAFTTLTLFFGTNPLGSGPRLWLGCCGVYFQPSEPLKLMLVVYLAAYFADHQPLRLRFMALIWPTFFMIGLALIILVVQRDLGTASIFLFIYAIMIYLATGRKRVLFISLSALVIAGLVGYYFVGIIQTRLESWFNPWVDPSGRSYQIIQSLIAVANGGMLGRGLGLGSPGLVPIAHSDFIYVSIAEEYGILGTTAMLGLLALFVARGLRIALHAPDNFRRLLAAGLSTYLCSQSILIIGGNLRLLPLTGVTLPFVSYGGSSLLTAFIACLFLLLISNRGDEEPISLQHPQPYLVLGGVLGLGLTAAAVANGWWALWRGPDLLTRSDNPRRAISDRYVKRGDLLDRNNAPIDSTEGDSGDYRRTYLYPELASVTGYTNPTFGQNGVEASLDPYLRGLDGNPASLIWWNHMLYGQPPPGLDVRLSLDLGLQRIADSSLGDHAGAIVLLNAGNGEVLVMASHPTFDPNKLDEIGSALLKDPRSPLLDRVTFGQYPLGSAVAPFLVAGSSQSSLDDTGLVKLFDLLGFYTAPDMRIQVAQPTRYGEISDVRISPLQLALAAATLSNDGVRPPPRLVMAVNTLQQGWVILPALSKPVDVFAPGDAERSTELSLAAGQFFWETRGSGQRDKTVVTWYLAGTLPNWQGAPLVVVVGLEETNPALAEKIGRMLIEDALKP
jgi:cell division protein FtsW (lipid II flippase)